ncbi:Rieske 2Fe-2S domain-containing protein [Phytomonospora sp. NPDC050363]|uniref:Rieske (2Fe-2S) protein n=1 Tax=Phytomonospora sp. NPDC050363 TaxID=3155642 RepID=UPI0034071F98
MNELKEALPGKSAVEIAGEVARSSRRGVLCGALGASAVAVLAACGSETEPPAPSGDNPPADNAPSGATSEKPGSENALAKLSDIPVGGGLVAGSLILVQPETGKVVAFNRTCPHKGVQLPAPQDGSITCPSHGSVFKAADGSLSKGPATSGLTEVEVEVTDGEVFAV